MTEPYNHTRIKQALDMLAEEGRKGYKEEYQKDADPYAAAGLALAAITDSARNYLQLAYCALEDHNYHDINACLEWIYPLYDQSFHVNDLDRLKRRIDKQEVTVLTRWNAARMDYETKRVRVRLVIEDIESDAE